MTSVISARSVVDYPYRIYFHQVSSKNSHANLTHIFYKFSDNRKEGCPLPAIILSILKHNVMTVGLSIFKDVIDTTEGKVVIYRLSKLEEWGIRNTSRLPYSIKILLESLLRHLDGILWPKRILNYAPNAIQKKRTTRDPFYPGQGTFTGFYRGSCYCRSFCYEISCPEVWRWPARINPVIPQILLLITRSRWTIMVHRMPEPLMKKRIWKEPGTICSSSVGWYGFW